MLLPCTNDYENSILTINRTSVDRIDSAQGYTPDNIQFVAVIANFAKNIFTQVELFEFCQSVYSHRNLANNKTDISQTGDDADVILMQELNITHQNNFVNLPCQLTCRRDKYSPFRQHLILARKHVKNKLRECNITLEYLREIWLKQGGICPYTGWELENPKTTNGCNGYLLHPRRASLDRINSAFGYVPGNVQFVSIIANYAKRDFTEAELFEFCQAVVDYNLAITG